MSAPLDADKEDLICAHVLLILLNELGIAQWLNGRVLDSRPRGRGFEPHRHHGVVVLKQDTLILA